MQVMGGSPALVCAHDSEKSASIVVQFKTRAPHSSVMAFSAACNASCGGVTVAGRVAMRVWSRPGANTALAPASCNDAAGPKQKFARELEVIEGTTFRGVHVVIIGGGVLAILCGTGVENAMHGAQLLLVLISNTTEREPRWREFCYLNIAVACTESSWCAFSVCWRAIALPAG